MPKVSNLNGDEWDRIEDRPGCRSKDAWVGAHIGGELIGGSMYELEPGDRLWPYHVHHANEEWLLVIRGRPTLRTSEGEHDLQEGDVVAFPRGEEGAHQVSNKTRRADPRPHALDADRARPRPSPRQRQVRRPERKGRARASQPAGPRSSTTGTARISSGSGFSLTSSLGRNACDSLALQPHIGLRLKPEPIGSTF